MPKGGRICHWRSLVNHYELARAHELGMGLVLYVKVIKVQLAAYLYFVSEHSNSSDL